MSTAWVSRPVTAVATVDVATIFVALSDLDRRACDRLAVECKQTAGHVRYRAVGLIGPHQTGQVVVLIEPHAVRLKGAAQLLRCGHARTGGARKRGSGETGGGE